MKEETIKWLTYHIDEINNNALSTVISEEDTIKNQELVDEITKCIEWVKTKNQK